MSNGSISILEKAPIELPRMHVQTEFWNKYGHKDKTKSIPGDIYDDNNIKVKCLEERIHKIKDCCCYKYRKP